MLSFSLELSERTGMPDTNVKVVAICITPVAGGAMQRVKQVVALAGLGLEGDRYATGEGSFNRKKGCGHRQVTLINGIFFPDSGFDYVDSRRNIVVEGVELNWLVGRLFRIGNATMHGIKYCDPCERPNTLAGKEHSFKQAFFDRGGIVAAVVEGGLIIENDLVIPPPKDY